MPSINEDVLQIHDGSKLQLAGSESVTHPVAPIPRESVTRERKEGSDRGEAAHIQEGIPARL